MKLQDYRDTFYSFSGKASDLTRQLALAAIAIVWLFKIDVGGSPTLPRELLIPSALIVAALTADGVQYLVGSFVWQGVYRHFEKKGVGEDVDLSHSEWLERPITALFYIKVILVVIAYVLLLAFLSDRMNIREQVPPAPAIATESSQPPPSNQ